jgi:hypothetical protein
MIFEVIFICVDTVSVLVMSYDSLYLFWSVCRLQWGGRGEQSLLFTSSFVIDANRIRAWIQVNLSLDFSYELRMMMAVVLETGVCTQENLCTGGYFTLQHATMHRMLLSPMPSIVASCVGSSKLGRARFASHNLG